MPRKTATPPPAHRYVPLTEASDYSGRSVRTLRQWIAEGILPAYRFGPRLLQVDLNDIDALRVRIPTRSASGGDAA